MTGPRVQQDDDALIRRIAALRKVGATDDEVRQIVREHDGAASFAGTEGGSSTTAIDTSTMSDLERMAAGLPYGNHRVEKHPVREAITRAALANPLTGPLYLGLRNVDPEASTVGAARGLTLDYGDEAASGAMALGGAAIGTPGTIAENYTKRRDAIRDYEHGLAKRSPGSTALGQVSGSLAPMALSGGASAAEAAPGLVKSTLKAGAYGFGFGAAAGYGGAEGAQGDQLAQALESGAWGTAFGVALPTIGRAVGRLLEKPAEKAARLGQKMAFEALRRDGYTAEQAIAEVERLAKAGAGNKPASLLDLAKGDNVRGAAAGVHSQPGPGRATIQGVTDARKAGQAERLQQDFTATSGTPAGSPALDREAILAKRRVDDRANYGASVDAMGDTPIDDPALTTLLTDKPSLVAAARVAQASEAERVGNSAMAARNAPGATIGESAAETTAKKNARGLFTSARDASGALRKRADTISDEGLIEELKNLHEQVAESARRTEYARVDAESGSTAKRTVGTLRPGTNRTLQSEAMQNHEDWQNRIAQFEGELKKRGYSETSIAEKLWGEVKDEAMLEREAMQAESAGSGGADDWLFDPNAPVPDTPETPKRLPTARELQRMKMALDQKIRHGALEDPFAPGAVHADAHELQNTRASLVDRMNANIPGYQEANASSAAAIGKAKALTAGAQMYGKHPDVVGESYRALRSDAERDAFRRAYGQRYITAIGGGSGGSDRAAAVFGTTGTVPGGSTKLAQARQAFADDASFTRFLEGLSAEGRISVGNRVTGNSSSVGKLSDVVDQARSADLARNPLVKAGKSALNMNFGDAATTLLSRSMDQRAARLGEAGRGELANILTAQREAVRDPMTGTIVRESLADYLTRALQSGAISPKTANALARALGGYSGLAGNP